GFVEIVVDDQHDDPVGPVTRDLVLDHLQILAERRAADAETVNLDSIAAVAEGGGEPLAEAAVIGHLQRLDIAVANDRDPADAGPPRRRIITDAGIPALRIDTVGRRNFVAHPPNAALVRRVADGAIDEVVGRHVARQPNDAERDELAKREEYRDAGQHQANID